MNKEKQIEEMEISLREAQHELDKAWHECLHNNGTQPRREFLFTAQYLVENKGYRKASEIVEEVTEAVKKSLLAFHLDEDRRYNTASIKTARQMDVATARYRGVTDTLLAAVKAMIELKNNYTKEER